mmetsp:Transcript_19756/g.59941  ORF Transcript_19756/g.59941 Transcript_19756/m.59941 type:complete len:210 (-) Transcript_19756:1476-2105(-)
MSASYDILYKSLLEFLCGSASGGLGGASIAKVGVEALAVACTWLAATKFLQARTIRRSTSLSRTLTTRAAMASRDAMTAARDSSKDAVAASSCASRRRAAANNTVPSVSRRASRPAHRLRKYAKRIRSSTSSSRARSAYTIASPRISVFTAASTAYAPTALTSMPSVNGNRAVPFSPSSASSSSLWATSSTSSMALKSEFRLGPVSPLS